MVTELIIFAPLILLYYLKIINLKFILILLFLIYWIPKPIVIGSIEYFFPKVVTREKINTINTFGKKIAITIDDVPYGNFKEIVSLLDNYNMKATFFVISDYINEQNENDLINAIKNGHQLGNHGKTNSMHLLKGSTNLLNEIKICDEKIEYLYWKADKKITNRVYRPGCGLFNNRMIQLAEQTKHKLVLGSVYPNDPIMIIPYINYLYLKLHTEPGDIVIIHDRKWTPKTLKYYLEWLQQNNFRSVILDELINY